MKRTAPANVRFFPVHHRDGERRGVCPYSGVPRITDDEPCPNGCAGAHEHYANDGHPECEEKSE